MEFKVEGVELTSMEGLDFNWVKCSIISDGVYSEYEIDLKIRIPKRIINLVEIQAYINYKIPNILKEIIGEVTI